MPHRWFGRPAVAACLTIALGTPGCTRARRPTAHPSPPELTEATPQTKCGVRRSADKPLIVEWPAADRAALEARANAGLVAVRYEGCEMEILSGCEVDGQYAFVALTRKHERVSIRDEDELYARLPVGAASLEGKLARAGELTVDLTVVGRKQADRHVFERNELRGNCRDATHVLTGLTVGAFSLLAGASTEAAAGVEVGPAGVGAGVQRARELLASDGDPAQCDADSFDGGPAPACSALLRVEAVPLAGSMPAVAEASAATLFTPTRKSEAQEKAERRAHRRTIAWRTTAISSGVLSAGSLGMLVGGAVLLGQYNDDTFGFDAVETDADRAKRRLGTTLIASGVSGVLGFGALAWAASVAARRGPTVSASLSPTFAGLSITGRF